MKTRMAVNRFLNVSSVQDIRKVINKSWKHAEEYWESFIPIQNKSWFEYIKLLRTDYWIESYWEIGWKSFPVFRRNKKALQRILSENL